MNERTKNFAAWWLSLDETGQLRVASWEIGQHLDERDVAALEAAAVTMPDHYLSIEDWSLIGLGQWWSFVLSPQDRDRVIAELHDPNAATRFLSQLSLHRQPGPMASFRHPDEPITAMPHPFSAQQIAFLEEAGRQR